MTWIGGNKNRGPTTCKRNITKQEHISKMLSDITKPKRVNIEHLVSKKVIDVVVKCIGIPTLYKIETLFYQNLLLFALNCDKIGTTKYLDSSKGE